MKIKNYTSQVPAFRSIAEIDQILVEFGARNISKTYSKSKKLESIMFELPNPLDSRQFYTVKLPARLDAVKHAIATTRPGWSDVDLEGQAERTAWRLMLDWVKVQLSLVSMEQVEPLEVFMAYIYNHSKQATMFELASQNHFKALPEPK